MAVVKVGLDARSYRVHIVAGGLERLGNLLAGRYEARRCALVSSPKVFRLHGDVAERALTRAGFDVETIITPDGERAKTPPRVTSLHNRLAFARLERTHPIVVLAGGTLGDLAGYAAATYLRGVPLVHVPTTLMAQVDSAIGGKTGVNLRHGKNLVGAFWQPGLVLCDPTVLSTLPEREFRAGLAEVIKYGCIASPRLLNRLHAALWRSAIPGQRELARWIVECVRIKAHVVSKDEREGGLRRILNFGHTFGHAVEQSGGYGHLLHGEAVALGMAVALQLSQRCAGLEASQSKAIVELIRRCFPDLKFPRLEWTALARALGADKKTASGRNVWIVISRPGRPGTVTPTEREVRQSIALAQAAWG